MSLNFSFAITWHQAKLSCEQKKSMTIHVLPTSPKQIKNPSKFGAILTMLPGCSIFQWMRAGNQVWTVSRAADSDAGSMWVKDGIFSSRNTQRFFKGFPIGGPCWDRGTSLPIPWGSMKMREFYTQVRSNIGFVLTTTSNTWNSISNQPVLHGCFGYFQPFPNLKIWFIQLTAQPFIFKWLGPHQVIR